MYSFVYSHERIDVSAEQNVSIGANGDGRKVPMPTDSYLSQLWPLTLLRSPISVAADHVQGRRLLRVPGQHEGQDEQRLQAERRA